MTATLDHPVPTAATGAPRRRHVALRPDRPVAGRLLVPLAVADLVANVLIVVTGGAVRLTASGLGCPTWPRCTEESYVAHGELGLHGAIEFGNRLLTFVLAAVAVATLVAAWRAVGRPGRGDRRVTLLALAVFLGIPAQGVLGGVTVLTDLNPWVVSLHFMLSMVLIVLCTWLLDAVRGRPRAAAGRASARLALGAFALGWVALYLGTVVTGSGPHSGDLESRRTGLDPQLLSHVHAWSVYVLVATTVALLVVARRRGEVALASAAGALLVLELAQGAVGFVQYFTGLPEVLVGVHMLGAALLASGTAWVLLRTRARGTAPAATA
ncbi:cytochrome c oxidase assembly protein subunit 15 [Nocardioides perillae]|uniref:Cytochrome c oxidase assembly protein subunit 15 n=1 Tax=Nocardioides perillae TaxID=1119534 RepID=A0A7Y9RWE8_9ACTN|nr:cytochrome c oxidase assembly protein subunit 15 [Nocardioides perillae]